MSRKSPSAFELAELQVACAQCSADRGAWCRTASGSWYASLHSSRYWRVWPILEPVVDDYERQLGEMRADLDAWRLEARRLRTEAAS
jgi:hypothetical protein